MGIHLCQRFEVVIVFNVVLPHWWFVSDACSSKGVYVLLESEGNGVSASYSVREGR